MVGMQRPLEPVRKPPHWKLSVCLLVLDPTSEGLMVVGLVGSLLSSFLPPHLSPFIIRKSWKLQVGGGKDGWLESYVLRSPPYPSPVPINLPTNTDLIQQSGREVSGGWVCRGQGGGWLGRKGCTQPPHPLPPSVSNPTRMQIMKDIPRKATTAPKRNYAVTLRWKIMAGDGFILVWIMSLL